MRLLSLIKKESKEWELLLTSAPPLSLAALLSALCLMNFAANKSIDFPFTWFALDCGVIVSWSVFLLMDVFVQYYGVKAASELALTCLAGNLLFSFFLYLIGLIPGSWSAAANNPLINRAIDRLCIGNWYIILFSAIAFISATLIHNFLFGLFKRFFKEDSLKAYLFASYVSTAVAQFADNFIFALGVSRVFFAWTLLQCGSCALFGMFAEMIGTFLFAPYGYKLCCLWQKRGIGKAYLERIKKE